MLHFVFGRVGSGKTTHIRRLLADYARAGMNDMILIVPEQFSFATEKEMLSLLGARDADRVDVLSFSRLAERVFARCGHCAGKPLDDGTRAVLMSRALEQMSDKLNFYSNVSGSAAVTSELTSLSAEMKLCAVTPADLARASRESGEGVFRERVGEIASVLEAYEALTAEKFRDSRDALSELYDLLGSEKYFENRIVAIDAFRGFTREEYRIIERILVSARSAYVTLCTDGFSRDDGSLGPFGHTRRTADTLRRIARENNVGIAKPLDLSGPSKFCNFPSKLGRFASPALGALEAMLFDPSAPVYDDPAPEITLCAAGDIGAECAWVAHTAKRLIREQGYRCRDIAVIARSTTSYEAQIKSALVKCGIPVFEDRRQPVAAQPLINFALAAADIADKGFATDAVMRYLKTGLTGLDPEESAELENYVILWNINGRAWRSDFTGHPRGLGFEMTEEDAAALASINSFRDRVISGLAEFCDTLRLPSATGEGDARALWKLVCDTHAGENLQSFTSRLYDEGEDELADEQKRVWEIFVSMLDCIASASGGTVMTPQRFSELLKLVVGVQSLGDIPRGLDEITIGSADRIRTSSPKAVFVVGVNDGVFPKPPETEGILDETDRERLREMDIPLSDSAEYRSVEERFIAYNTLCSASERLYVSYARSNLSGAAMSPSPLVSELSRMFPHCTRRDTEDIPKTELIEGAQPAFSLLCTELRHGGELAEALGGYFAGREDYRDKLRSLERAAGNSGFRMNEPQTARALFGSDMYLSASRIETYHTCPFKYFCSAGLGAKVPGKSEIDPLIYGTLVHRVLERMLAYPRDVLRGMSPDKILEEIKKITGEYLRDFLGGEQGKSERFMYTYNKYAETLRDVTLRLIAEFETSSFEPVDFELKIDRDGEIPPYEVKTESGDTVYVRGSVDRVDVYKNEKTSYVRVIDYKSGGKKFELGEVFFGLNMQMLIYLFAIWAGGGERYGDVTPAGMLYYPAKSPMTSEDSRRLDDEKIKEKKQAALRMSGMVLDSAEVISAMEAGGAGRFISMCIGKDGRAKGNVIPFAALEKLRDTVNEILANMADSLHNGRIDALPISSSGRQGWPCGMCEYIAVCGHEEGMSTRVIAAEKFDNCVASLMPKPESPDGEDDGEKGGDGE